MFDEGSFPALTTAVLTGPASEIMSPASPMVISLPQSLSTTVPLPRVLQPARTSSSSMLLPL